MHTLTQRLQRSTLFVAMLAVALASPAASAQDMGMPHVQDAAAHHTPSGDATPRGKGFNPFRALAGAVKRGTGVIRDKARLVIGTAAIGLGMLLPMLPMLIRPMAHGRLMMAAGAFGGAALMVYGMFMVMDMRPIKWMDMK